MSELRVLQRVVFPMRSDLDVVPLYVETNLERGATTATLERAAAEPKAAGDGFGIDRPAAAVETQSSIRFAAAASGMGDLANRRSADISAGARVSFGTYFNAFPAGYWRRWSVLDEIVLRMRVIGDCSIIVYRSTAQGHSYPVESTFVEGELNYELTLPLDTFIDGGWYWFDIAAAGRDVRLEWAEWSARTDRTDVGRFSIGITTFNRTDFCVRGLAVLGEASNVLDSLDRVYVVDQGRDRVVEHPDFAMAVKPFEDRVHVIDQANLGGSGGFARAMDETVQAGDSDYVLLLDDDVVTEP
jgi:galactofuranosylgalactofuranosylrhamnosyl-N-acetylglucosaminyl-diphospho-decaprenol beta-1,5/1,6-galactofuranosyltransferase